MTQSEDVKDTISTLCDQLTSLEVAQLSEVFDERTIEKLFTSIAPRKEPGEETIYDYFLRNKERVTTISQLHHFIQVHYSLQGHISGHVMYASPQIYQWYDHGVMLVQGSKRWEGQLALYQNGDVKFGIMQRDIARKGYLGKEDIKFISIEETKQIMSDAASIGNIDDLKSRLEELSTMLTVKEDDESKYQQYFERNPWVFGAQYKSIQGHSKLDDENIPDFTGVRAKDGARDIIEMKPPFMPLFKEDGEFRSEFSSAFNQAERYLDFTRRDADYLNRQKGLRFENPKVLLLAGYELNEQQRRSVNIKTRMNPAIELLAYEDIVALGKSTIEFLEQLQATQDS